MKKSTIYILTLSICLMGYPTSIKSDPLTMLGFLFLKIAPSLPILTATVTSFVTSYKIFEWINTREHLKTRRQLNVVEERLSRNIGTVYTSVQGVGGQLAKAEERLSRDIGTVSNAFQGGIEDMTLRIQEVQEDTTVLRNGQANMMQRQDGQDVILQAISERTTSISDRTNEGFGIQLSPDQLSCIAAMVAEKVARHLESRLPISRQDQLSSSLGSGPFAFEGINWGVDFSHVSHSEKSNLLALYPSP